MLLNLLCALSQTHVHVSGPSLQCQGARIPRHNDVNSLQYGWHSHLAQFFRNSLLYRWHRTSDPRCCLYEDLPVEDLSRLFTVKDLQSILKARGLKVSGSKKDLVTRLVEAASGAVSGIQNEAVEEAGVKQNLEALTVMELKARLKDHGLQSSGKKADLVTRLSQATLPDPVDTVGSVVEDSLARQTQMDVQLVTPEETVQANKPLITKPVELNIDSRNVKRELDEEKILLQPPPRRSGRQRVQQPPRRSGRQRYTKKGFVDRVFEGASTYEERAWQPAATPRQAAKQKNGDIFPDSRKVSWETEVNVVKEKLLSEVCDHELWTEHEEALTSWGCDVELWKEVGWKYGSTQTQELARLATEGDEERAVELVSLFRKACRMPAAARANDKPKHDPNSEGQTQARVLSGEYKDKKVESIASGADRVDGNSVIRNWAIQSLLQQPSERT